MFGFPTGRGRKGVAGLTALGMALLAAPLASTWAVAQESAPELQGTADPAAATTPLAAEQVASARESFNTYSCGACHALSDASATGQIGPALDGNSNLDHDFIVDRVVNGQGAMPGFGGQIADEDIDLLATYIMQVKK